VGDACRDHCTPSLRISQNSLSIRRFGLGRSLSKDGVMKDCYVSITAVVRLGILALHMADLGAFAQAA